MKTARFIVAGLVAVMILLGDCTESEARCRLFGRRHRKSCAPCTPPCGAPTDGTWLCPTQQTPYPAGESGGVKYYMFYAQYYDPNHYPHCWGMPQPVYLPDQSPTGCAQGAPCWKTSRMRASSRTDYPMEAGHRMSEEDVIEWGRPFKQHRINFGDDAAPDWRYIDLHIIRVDGHVRPLWVGFENPYAIPGEYSDPPTGHTKGDWNGHAYGRTVDLTGIGRPYYVLLKAP